MRVTKKLIEDPLKSVVVVVVAKMAKVGSKNKSFLFFKTIPFSSHLISGQR
jgi:hypothetical protein